MSTEDYAVLFVEGEKAGEAYPLTSTEVSVGRSRSNQVVFADDQLSRKHLVFRRIGTDVVVEDMDSAHGSFLNDKRLRGILSLSVGDVVQIGSQKMKFVPYSEVADLAEQSLQEVSEAAGSAGVEDEAEIADEDQDKTRFGTGDELAEDELSEDELDETRYHEVQKGSVWDQEEDAKTRVLEDQATRMLDIEELQGLKPGKGDSALTAKMMTGIALVVLLLAGAGGMIWYMGREVEDPGARSNYVDSQYDFALRYPSIWQKTSTDPDAAIVFEHREGGNVVAYMKVYGAERDEFTVSGLSAGFEEYKQDLAARHQEYRLKGSKVMDLNNLRIVQYGFSATGLQGFGIFAYSGNRRYDIEVGVVSSHYGETKETLLGLLKTFALRGPQQYIDFPLPDQDIKNLSLSQPDALAEEGRRNLALGLDMMERELVRPDNLYRAIEQFRFALTKSTALYIRPDYHAQAAEELRLATRKLNDKVDDQWFKVSQATKTGDFGRVKWELTKLLQLVPDKNDPIHRKAKQQLKR